MNSAIERLLSLRVADVMSRNVVEVAQHQTMAEAAASLVEKRISGAPVVDEHGHCVGMLTAADFMRWEAERHRNTGSLSNGEAEHRVIHDGPDEPLRIDTLPSELVATHMAPAVQSVAAGDTLLHAARAMCANHVHRLPVLGERGRVEGVISSLDIVAATVHAVEE